MVTETVTGSPITLTARGLIASNEVSMIHDSILIKSPNTCAAGYGHWAANWYMLSMLGSLHQAYPDIKTMVDKIRGAPKVKAPTAVRICASPVFGHISCLQLVKFRGENTRRNSLVVWVNWRRNWLLKDELFRV